MSTNTKGKHRARQTNERRHGRKSRNQKLTSSFHFSYCPTPQRINQSYGIIYISSPPLRFLLCLFVFLFLLLFAHRKAIAISFRKSNPKQFTWFIHPRNASLAPASSGLFTVEKIPNQKATPLRSRFRISCTQMWLSSINILPGPGDGVELSLLVRDALSETP